MSEAEKRVRDALLRLADGLLADRVGALLGTLGYRSDRTIDFESVGQFLEEVNAAGKLPAGQLATFEQWKDMDVVFQVTNDEVAGANDLPDAHSGDSSVAGQPPSRQFNRGVAQSFLFLAVDLKPGRRLRSDFTASTRAVNRIFPMPTVVFFRHTGGDAAPRLTIAVIHRRLHSRDPDRDVLERVSLIQDISPERPHRAHLQLLSELALGRLIGQRGVSNFDQLLAAWEAVLDTAELNRRFYRDLFTWFQRATNECTFPDDGVGDGNSERQVIRLITRLLFVWFLKEKRLVPDALFKEAFAREQLKRHAGDATDYYRAVLQNVFFATLNTEIRRRAFSQKDQSTHRDFTRYRYRALLRDPDGFAKRLRSVPFVDGGLFDCLDDFEHVGRGGRRVDAFTDNVDDPAHGGMLSVPARLFFDENGLFPLFGRYKFTVEENTTIDEEIALDPELLGRTFENLLASYNPETRDTARKATGSYYTPRRVVDYMVDEALAAHFRAHVPPHDGDVPGMEARLRDLLATQSADSDSPAGHQMHDDEIAPLIAAIDALKVLDPACGSGAFPMGILQKLVSVLAKIDPDNQRWKARQMARASEIPDPVARRDAVAAVEKSFSPQRNYGDYGRKLYLIQNVIHGVDIQPIACQIAKLRFFISLVVEQQSSDDPDDNYGIQALPNLETRFVAADALIGLNGPSQRTFPSATIKSLEEELEQIRSDWFDARTRNQKWELKKKDKELRRQLRAALIKDDWSTEAANLIAAWDPYDQNRNARWFDPEWMFGAADGFDIVIGNPPYVESRNSLLSLEMKDSYGEQVRRDWSASLPRGSDLLIYFYARGFRVLATRGHGCFITHNAWLSTDYGKKFQDFSLDKASFDKIVDTSDKFFSDTKSQNINAVITLFSRTPGKNIEYVVADSRMAFHAKKEIDAASNMKWGHLIAMPEYLSKALNRMSPCVGRSAKKPSARFGQGLNFPKHKLQDKHGTVPILILKGQPAFAVADSPDRIPSSLARSEDKIPALVMPRGIGNKHYCIFNSCRAFSYSAVELYLPAELWESDLHYCLWAYMNSSLVWLYREVTGRKNLGGGLLKAEATDMKTLPLDCRFDFSDEARTVFDVLRKREPLPADQEVYTDEHLAIDEMVSKFFGLEDRQESLRRDLVRQVGFRTARARKGLVAS